MSSSNSYSSLLRRSKLSSFNPSIDQVYSTPPAHLSRSSFGLKRPLPQSKTTKAPFVRITKLDNAQKRTEFRKATREIKFVKKWAETGVAARQSNDRLEPGGIKTLPQSWLVPGHGDGSVQSPEKILADFKSNRGGVVKAPNVFTMEEEEFTRLLESLGERREEFRSFVSEAAAVKSGSASTQLVDLYEHAQQSPLDLNTLLQRFLSTTVNHSHDTFKPLAAPHPTLSLQYYSPTLLEAALAPPVPGRLLAIQSGGNNNNGRSQSTLTSVIGHISTMANNKRDGKSATTFFPDQGSPPTRSNVPGRVLLDLRPIIMTGPITTLFARRAQRGTNLEYNSNLPAHESVALAMKPIELNPAVYDPRLGRGVLPGTQAYSGNETNNAFGRNSGPRSATELYPQMDGKVARDLSLGFSAKEKYERNQKRQLIAADRKRDDYTSLQQSRQGGQKSKAKKAQPLDALFDMLNEGGGSK